MRHHESKYDFHIGNIIKEIAAQRDITSNRLAEAIDRYDANESKIFKLEDMFVDDVIRISYLLKYNILERLCKKYLSHLPPISKKNGEQYTVTLDMRTKRYTSYGNYGNCDFLKDIHIGRFIKGLAKENKWNEQDVATRLDYTQSMVSDLYRRESIKVKQLFHISDALSHHLVDELYLSRMLIVPSLADYDQCIISINGGNIRIKNPKDENFFIFFRPDDKK